MGAGGCDIHGVKFAKGSGEFRGDLASDGTIKDAVVRLDGDGTLGGVADCALEVTLKSSLDTAPIRLWLTDRSGGSLLPVTFERKVAAAVESGIQPRIPFSLTTN